MARKSKQTTIQETSQNSIKRESTKRSNAEIAAEVKNGKYGDNWEYAVRKLGYSVNAVKVLLR